MATVQNALREQFLNTAYRPDREYVDGRIRERNVGKYEHARVQALLTSWFFMHERQWNMQVVTEQRIETAPNIRIADVALLAPGRHPDMICVPPILIVEILSPDDTYEETQEEALDYRKMGVDSIWILDPATRTGRMWNRAFSGIGWREATRLEVDGGGIFVDLNDLFRRLG